MKRRPPFGYDILASLAVALCALLLGLLWWLLSFATFCP